MIRKEKTAVYKHIGQDGEVIYVGLTNHMPRRVKEHDKSSYWFDDVKSIDISWFDSRQEAIENEKRMIMELLPRHNIHHNIDEQEDGDGSPRKPWSIDYGISSRDIIYFLSLVETMSHAKAANLLGVTQPSVSIGIKRLQEKTGIILVKKSGVGASRGKVELTDAGVKMIGIFKEVDKSYRKMLSEIEKISQIEDEKATNRLKLSE